MGKTFHDFLEDQLKDPEFREEYEALQPETSIISAILHAKVVSGITEEILSQKTGISIKYIHELESGNANPSLRTLKRLADGLGKKLEINFL